MPVKVLDDNGYGQDSDIVAGVVWAADSGASVIVMGFSNPGSSQALQDGGLRLEQRDRLSRRSRQRWRRH